MKADQGSTGRAVAAQRFASGVVLRCKRETSPAFRSDPMADLSAFPITRRWPAADPTRLQLYSVPTPNGVKVSIMLEETGIPYEPHLVDFGKSDQKTPEFLSLDPNGKIPAILDPDGPGGKPLGLFESGAILQYLAEKTGQFLPADPAKRWHAIQWLHFQMGGVGPMFGQVGFFNKFGQGFRGQASARPLCGGIEAAARRHGRASGDASMVYRRRLHHRGYFDARLGAQPDRVLRGARDRRIRRLRTCRELV
jgi:glutathione S-transferase